METANHRTVNQMIIGSVVTTCQFADGYDRIKTGKRLEYNASSRT